jgi:predicted Zn-dependent protease
MLDVAREAVEAARRAGADYADARWVLEENESITVKNEEMEGIDRSRSDGIGIRVLAGGFWGFAATARSEDPAEVERTAALAVEIARAASRLPREPVRLSEVEPVTDTWETTIQEDPFAVSLEEKVSLLMEASRRMRAVPGLSFAEAMLDFYRKRSALATSEGAAIEQTITHSGGGIEATAIGDGELQRRSFPNSFRGHIAAAGYEHIRALGLLEESERLGTEAVELLSAKDCPSEETTLILDGPQMVLQVHESVGHPIELDRVFGTEASYAGTSFLTTDKLAEGFQYGSELVDIVADATAGGGLGTFGWDDEGVAAQQVPAEVLHEVGRRRVVVAVLGVPGAEGPEERLLPDLHAGALAHAGEVRHCLHLAVDEPGRRAGAHLHRRQRAPEPRRHRDGPGADDQGGADRRRGTPARPRARARHRHVDRQGAQYLADRRLERHRHQRRGGARGVPRAEGAPCAVPREAAARELRADRARSVPRRTSRPPRTSPR